MPRPFVTPAGPSHLRAVLRACNIKLLPRRPEPGSLCSTGSSDGKDSDEMIAIPSSPHRSCMIAAGLFAVLVACVLPANAQTAADERLRLIVETDAGGDPDDEQSLVRFLLYASDWDVEG